MAQKVPFSCLHKRDKTPAFCFPVSFPYDVCPEPVLTNDRYVFKSGEKTVRNKTACFVSVLRTCEELLEVRLNNARVLRLAKNFQQVVVADEIEPREARALLLEELGEGLLAALELVEHDREVVLQVGHLGQRDDARVGL